MKELTASEAAPRANGLAVADVLARWTLRLAVDDGFAADVESAGDSGCSPIDS